jgi:large subunit ribosomal protein L20
VRINAAVRPYGLSYSQFMNGIKISGIDLNRKMLSELAINEPKQFEKIVKTVQANLAK